MTTEMPQALLEARDIGKAYGGARALDDVSLAVLPGQVLALLGENGAGKSTLTKIIAGIVRPDTGAVLVDGREVTFSGPAQAHAHGVRAVPQELTLCRDMTVAENICLGAMPTKRGRIVDRAALAAESARRLALLGVQLDPGAYVRDLSLPERSFVQIAQALHAGTRVLIADEPTAPLSGGEVDHVLTALRALADRGLGIIYISHRLEEVYRIADELVVLRDGHRVGHFRRGAFDPADVVAAMLGGRAGRGQGAEGTATERPVITVGNLSARGLNDLSLTVSAGEIVGVYGVLGSGREQVAPAVVGAVPVTAGTVTVNGKAADLAKGVRATRHAGIGYIPAERRSQGLVMNESLRFNLTLGILATLKSGKSGIVLDRAREQQIVTRWIDELGIKGDPEAPVASLSGGNQQKVLVGRWLAAGSEVLVLDEPTRGVDIGAKADMYATLRKQAAQGAAILVCSSDIEEIAHISDRVIVMKYGRAVQEIHTPTEQAVAAAALS